MKIDKTLEEINNTSLIKILFYKQSLSIPSLDFYNIIFAGNGVFTALKNEFGVLVGKIKNLTYTNTELSDLDETIYSFIPKPTIPLFNEILEMFKYVNLKMDAELCVNVYYHKVNKTFHLSLIDQIISGAAADYKYDEKFEMSTEYVRYLQIHSHNTMAANFSSKDDKDENFTAPCYFGVVGKLCDNSQYYNVDSKYRIWDGMKFVSIDFGDIFDTGIQQVKLQPDIVKRLDMLIKISEKIAKEKFKYPFNNTTQYPLLELFDDDDKDDIDMDFINKHMAGMRGM